MPEPTDTPIPDVPVRRVTFTVTGYLRHGHPAAGWYDMQSAADGGQHYSIPEFEVDESTVRDAEPERLSETDWDEIAGHVLARYGKQTAERILAAWERAAADVDAQRSQEFQAARRPEPVGDLGRRVRVMEATLKRVRALAAEWSAMDGPSAVYWRDASRILHATLDGPGDEEADR